MGLSLLTLRRNFHHSYIKYYAYLQCLGEKLPKNSKLRDCDLLAMFLDLGGMITMICMKKSLVPTWKTVDESNQKKSFNIWLTDIGATCQQLRRKADEDVE
jgi:hypothetical protein